MAASTLKNQLFFAWVLSAASAACLGREPALPLNLSITPKLFDSEFVTSASEEIDEARLHSGLGLKLVSELLAVDVDYKLQSVLKETTTANALTPNALNQQFNAVLKSTALNELFGFDAGIRADTVFRDGRNRYRTKVTPGISRSISDLARFSVNYDYELDKPASKRQPSEKRGYSMLLDGTARGGRLTWSGAYRNASIFEEKLVLTKAVEALDLKSRYLFGPALHVELSSAFRQETLFSGTGQSLLTRQRYGAAFAWSPSEAYSLALKVNSRNDSQSDRRDTYGSGSISWSPRPDLELILDYGDQVAEDDRGWVLHTRFDING